MKSFSAVALASAVALSAGVAAAENVKFGFLGGFTGPIEKLSPPILEGANLAIAQVNAAGGLSAGKIALVEADTGCVDTALAGSSADKLVNSEKVVAIVGALCSGATSAAATGSGIPGKVLMISPASTSPAITDLKDNDYVFRTAPSDAFQGQQLAKVLMGKGVKSVAVTYVNNDYGKGFADAFSNAFKGMGGAVAVSSGHEEGKSDYAADIAALEATGADTLVVLAYESGSGRTIVKQAVESGVFAKFVGGDGMVGDELVAAAGASALEGMIATKPGAPELAGKAEFDKGAAAAGVDPNGVFVAQSYDAAFLLALAAEKAGGDKDKMPAALRDVASAPGEVILPGQWAKAKKLIAEGKDVNYEGASGSHEFDANGDVPGVIVEMVVKGGKFVEIGKVE